MENRVGTNVPTPDEFTQIVKELDSIITRLKVVGVTLSPEERRGLSHARIGSDAAVESMLQLSERHNLAPRQVSREDVRNDYKLAQGMQPVVERLRAALQLAEDTQNLAESEYWKGALAFYLLIDVLSARDPELETEIKPMSAVMTNQRRKKDPA